MKVQSTYTARTYREVVIVDLPDESDRPMSDDMLVGYALHALNENPSSLFGHTVKRYPDERSAVVDLHTD